jgi:RNA polymerase sigma-70 factor, ECF subfamily
VAHDSRPRRDDVGLPPPSPEETLNLLQRVRAGEESALEVLLARLLPRMRRWAHGRLPHASRGLLETGDVVQSVLARAVKHLALADFNKSAGLMYYLREAVDNQIRSEWRRANRAPMATTARDSLPAQATSPLERLLGEERWRRYEAALQRLDVVERDIIVGRFELAYDYDDLARYLGKPSAGAARVAVHRAVKHLTEQARYV